jgi:hypothetical protein
VLCPTPPSVCPFTSGKLALIDSETELPDGLAAPDELLDELLDELPGVEPLDVWELERLPSKDGATDGIADDFDAPFATALSDTQAKPGASSAIVVNERTMEERRRAKTTSIQRQSVT